MVAQRAFRFGVTAYTASSASEWAETARSAESLGYSTLLIPEHLHCLPSMTGMLAAAQATTTLRVGSLVLANDFWHPLWLAREFAALVMFACDRVELGLRTGWMRDDYEQSGVRFDPPGVRIDRLEEAITVIKGLFQHAPFSFHGHYYALCDVSLQPEQQHRPPFLIGGGGRRMLALAARKADIVSINSQMTADGGFDMASLAPEVMARQIAWVREAAGSRFATLELNMLINIVVVTERRSASAEEEAASWTALGFPATADLLLGSPRALIGSVEEIVAQLVAQRERYQISYIVIPRDQMEAFAPVVARLAGA
jgi:probable F420-dependent oxidoreductase